ncbi:MAG: DNA-3-methyladenine glycosylase I [Thermomonas sp.]
MPSSATPSSPIHRCVWADGSEIYNAYHDHEWGRPVTNEIRLFEKISLEGFQAGLSWITILRKREYFRAAFDGFDFHKIVTYNDADVERLLGDAGIVRHRGKIEAVINNASRAIELQREFGSLATYFWQFEVDTHGRPTELTTEVVRAFITAPESIALSKDLKTRGWKFVGPTTMYAFMQAMGLVNDHQHHCFVRKAATSARAALGIARPVKPETSASSA